MNIQQIIPVMENLTGIRKFENMTWSQLVEYLTQQGFKYGSGADTHVFIHPQKEYVYKIIYPETGNLQYIEWALKHQNNEFVPKIISQPRPIQMIHTRKSTTHDEWFLVKMEKLIALDEERQEFIFQFNNYLLARDHGLKEFNPYENILDPDFESDWKNSPNNNGNSISLEQFHKKYAKYKVKQLADFIATLRDTVDEHIMLDIGSDNLMMRTDGSLVVVDPWYHTEGRRDVFNDISSVPTINDPIKKGRNRHT